MGRRVEQEVGEIPAGLSRWLIKLDRESGLTLEETIEKQTSRPTAKERREDPERWRRW